MTDSRVGLGTSTSTTQAVPGAPVPGQQEVQELQQGQPAEAQGVVLPDGTVVPQQGDARQAGTERGVEGASDRSIARGTPAERDDAARAELLAQAGVGRTGEVQDSANLRGTDSARSSAAMLGAAATLPPPAPRPVVMTDDILQGAEAFAANFDRVGNDAIKMMQSLLGNDLQLADHPMMRADMPLEEIVTYFMGAAFAQARSGEGATSPTGGQTGGQFGTAVSALTAGGETGEAQTETGEQGANAQGEAGATPGQPAPAGQADGARGQQGSNQQDGQSTGSGQRDVQSVDNKPSPAAQAAKEAVSSKDAPPAGGNQYFDAQGNLIVPPGKDPKVFAQENAAGIIKAAEQRAQSLLGLSGKGLGSLNEAQLRNVANLTADMMLAAFLKLNINDPNNNPENQNMLTQIATDMRQIQIDSAKKQAEIAEQQIKEAEKYAQQAKVISTVVTVIIIIIAIIITIISFGTATPATTTGAAVGVAAVNAGGQVATQSAIQLVLQAIGKAIAWAVSKMAAFAAEHYIIVIMSIIVTALLKGVSIGAEKTAADKSLEAQGSENRVKLHRMMADMFQGMIEDQNAIIKMIMESKNEIVEAVLKMMKASQSSSQAVMAAGAAKG